MQIHRGPVAAGSSYQQQTLLQSCMHSTPWQPFMFHSSRAPTSTWAAQAVHTQASRHCLTEM